MKVRIKVEHPQLKVDEVVSGRNAEEIVTTVKGNVAKKVPFALRLLINGMSPLGFAQEIVKRYNAEMKTNEPKPASCEEFLISAEKLGFVTILEK